MRGTRSCCDIVGVVPLKSRARLLRSSIGKVDIVQRGKGLTSLCPRSWFLNVDPENAICLTQRVDYGR